MLQCISQINQGMIRASPTILTAPEFPSQQNNGGNGDILSKLYLLLSKISEFW